MLTKYKLKIGSNEYELQEDDLKNWDEIKCVYKRADYGGVVRSFTSKFEFVNKAYQLLMAEFDKRAFRRRPQSNYMSSTIIGTTTLNMPANLILLH